MTADGINKMLSDPMKNSLNALVGFSVVFAAFADGPIGPPVDNRLMNGVRANDAVRRYQAGVKARAEANEREQQAAMERARRESQTAAEADAREREISDMIARRVRQTEERQRASFLESQWRVVNGRRSNLANSGWRHIEGKVLESHPEGMRVQLGRNETIWLTNYPYAVADNEPISEYGQSVGLHRYVTVLGATATLRKYDCGTPIDEPEDAKRSRLAKDKADEDRIVAEQQQYEASMRRAEEDRQRKLAAQREAIKARNDAALHRVLTIQHQQASNGLPSFQYELGKRYLSGDGVEANQALAIHWLKSACTNGSSLATNLLKVAEQPRETVTVKAVQ